MDIPVTPPAVRAHQLAILKLLKEFDRICAQLKIPYVLFAGSLLGTVRHQGFVPWDDDLDVLLLRSDYARFLREAPQVIQNEDFFLQSEFSAHWPMFFSKLRLNGTTCLEPYHPKDPACHQGVCMDIFPCDNAAGTELGRKLQFCASKIVIAKCLHRRGYDTSSFSKRLTMALCRLIPMKPALWLTRRGKPDSSLVHTFLGGARSYRKNVFPRAWLATRVCGEFEGGSYPIPAQYEDLLHLLYGNFRDMPPREQRAQKRHAIFVDLERSYAHYPHYRDGMTFDTPTRSIR